MPWHQSRTGSEPQGSRKHQAGQKTQYSWCTDSLMHQLSLEKRFKFQGFKIQIQVLQFLQEFTSHAFGQSGLWSPEPCCINQAWVRIQNRWSFLNHWQHSHSKHGRLQPTSASQWNSILLLQAALQQSQHCKCQPMAGRSTTLSISAFVHCGTAQYSRYILGYPQDGIFRETRSLATSRRVVAAREGQEIQKSQNAACCKIRDSNEKVLLLWHSHNEQLFLRRFLRILKQKAKALFHSLVAKELNLWHSLNYRWTASKKNLLYMLTHLCEVSCALAMQALAILPSFYFIGYIGFNRYCPLA